MMKPQLTLAILVALLYLPPATADSEAPEFQFDKKKSAQLMAESGIVHEYFHDLDEAIDKARKSKRGRIEIEEIRDQLVRAIKDLKLDLTDLQKKVRRLPVVEVPPESQESEQ